MTGTYAPWCLLQLFSLIGRRSGQLVVGDLSRMAMKFVRVMYGSKDGLDAASHLPSSCSHRSSGRVVGPTLQYTWQTNFSSSLIWVGSSPLFNWFWQKTLTKLELSEAVDRGMVVIECHVSFRPRLLRDTNKLPSPVGSGEVVYNPMTLLYSNLSDSLNNINLSVVCCLACQKLNAIQVSMTTP